MDFKLIRVKSFNLLLVFFITILLILLIFTSMIFLSTTITTDISIASILAAAILLLFCTPMSIIIYLSDKQIISKRIFLSLSITYVLLALSGVVWYVLPAVFNLPILLQIGKLLMIASYIPLLVSLGFTYNNQKKNLDKIIKTFIYYAIVAFCILLILFDLTNIYRGNNAFDVFIFSLSTFLDVIIVSLTIMLILINMPTQLRYLFSIIFGAYSFTFIGDILYLFQYLNLFDEYINPQFFYDIELLFTAAALVVYALSNIKITTIEEVNKKLKDTSLVVEDLIHQSPGPMCMCNVNGEVVKSNDEFDRLFKKTDNINIFNLNIDENISSTFIDVKSGKIVYVNSIKTTLDNKDIYLSLKLYPTFTSDRIISNYIFTAEDITTRKIAEDTLKNAYDELENRVKERTIELSTLNEALQKEIIEHKKDEEKIKASLKEKEVLLKEVHHRVKNNMQIISSMLGLQSNYINDPFLNNILQDSQNRIKSMALIHEKLYQSDNMAFINFSDYVNTLVLNLSQSYPVIRERIIITTKIENVSLNLNTAIPLGLIINELITNSFKHAFPKNKSGEMNIELIETNKHCYQLSIKDNGVGLPAGFDIENTKTLGLQLVRVLVEQIDGKLEIFGNNGVTFIIKFSS